MLFKDKTVLEGNKGKRSLTCWDKIKGCGSSSVDRASAFQAEGREFESRLPLKITLPVLAVSDGHISVTFVTDICLTEMRQPYYKETEGNDIDSNGT